MHHSPRTRRLHSDLAALERLAAESSVFRFSTVGDPRQQYHILFKGKGLCRDRGRVKILDQHRVEIKLGASYPRSMPEIRWVTPVFHPNISEIGMVCLGGYGTHWVPSIQLDELCVMLWDMVRYHNYDIRSPYNRESALWTAGQTNFRFPMDARPLRDLRASQGRAGSAAEKDAADSSANGTHAGVNRSRRPASASPSSESPVGRVLQFIERYGKVFGEASTPAPARAEVTAPPSRPRADADAVRHLVERVGRGTNEVVREPARANAATEIPQINREPVSPLPARAGTDQPDRDVDPREDVLIMESSPGDAHFDPPLARANDEVFFIE